MYFFNNFLYVLKSENKSLDLKDLGIFSVLVLLCRLCKLSYLRLIFLLFIIPKNKFEIPFYYNIISLLIVGALGVLWAKYYATPNYLFSYHADYFINYNVSAFCQMNYLLYLYSSSWITSICFWIK